ncbi:MAG TPA: hypothetical protein VM165_12660 [Planctomycetaceae bacterium]|nr:hypothetical protein [Planctomycetaceae bacterium]
MMTATYPMSLGHSRRPPTCDPVILFGPPKFSPAQQAMSPSRPMTRVVKDLLSVGTWNTGGPQHPTMTDFTADTLQALASSVAEQQAAGHAVNVGLSHGTGDMLIPTEQIIAPVDAAKFHNDVLWFSAYVTPEQAEALLNPAMKVSPGIMRSYYDGSGNWYAAALVHAAVTDRPVVAGQGPFLMMANAHQPVPMALSNGMKPVDRRVAEQTYNAAQPDQRASAFERLKIAKKLATEKGMPLYKALALVPK